MRMLRVAVGLTIWFSGTSVLLLLLVLSPVELPEFLVVLPVLFTVSYYLLPVRWALILLLLIQTAAAKPFARLPEARGLQVAFAVLLQSVLGMMSVVGLVLLWTDTSKIGDRVAGFVFHACVPLGMVLFLVRRANRLHKRA